MQYPRRLAALVSAALASALVLAGCGSSAKTGAGSCTTDADCSGASLCDLMTNTCTEPGSGSADPAQLLGTCQQLGWHGAVDGIRVDNVVRSVLGIDECFDHDPRYRAPDFLRPRRVDIGCEQQNFKAH